MKYDRKMIMTEAWRMKRETGISFAQALKISWAIAKQEAAEAGKMAPVETKMHYRTYKSIKHVGTKKDSYNANDKTITVIVNAVEYYAAKVATLIESCGFGECVTDMVEWLADLFGENWRAVANF